MFCHKGRSPAAHKLTDTYCVVLCSSFKSRRLAEFIAFMSPWSHTDDTDCHGWPQYSAHVITDMRLESWDLPSAWQAKLMRSWAVVCDVYFLEPQTQQKGESAAEFAARVQTMIAQRAKLTIAPWDGYLKYYNLGVKVEAQEPQHLACKPWATPLCALSLSFLTACMHASRNCKRQHNCCYMDLHSIYLCMALWRL